MSLEVIGYKNDIDKKQQRGNYIMYVNMLTSVWNSGAIIAVHVDPLNSHFSVTKFVSFSLWLFFF